MYWQTSCAFSEKVFPGTYDSSRSFLKLIFYRFSHFAPYRDLTDFYKDFNGVRTCVALTAQNFKFVENLGLYFSSGMTSESQKHCLNIFIITFRHNPTVYKPFILVSANTDTPRLEIKTNPWLTKSLFLQGLHTQQCKRYHKFWMFCTSWTLRRYHPLPYYPQGNILTKDSRRTISAQANDFLSPYSFFCVFLVSMKFLTFCLPDK